MSLPTALRLPRGRRLGFERPVVMGVLNVTPDSFSEGGRFVDPAAAAARAAQLVADGAHVLDVGGESTRPGSEPVSAAEQVRRVVPVIAAVRAADPEVVVSVDTTSAEVAAAALDAGADVVNDVSAFRWDDRMLSLLAERGVPGVAMHTAAAPSVMQDAPRYPRGVVTEVVAHLQERVRAAEAAGVDPGQLVLDPGLGFGKTLAHNLDLLRGLPALAALGHAVLVGPSRKRFLGALTGRPVTDRDRGTAAACALALASGAHMVRVHDAAAVRDAVAVGHAVGHGTVDDPLTG